jgi:hypothetical protein
VPEEEAGPVDKGMEMEGEVLLPQLLAVASVDVDSTSLYQRQLKTR